MDTNEKQTDQVYSCEYGSFTIQKTRFMYKSVCEKTGNDLVFGLTPEAVWTITPTHLMSHALGLKEEKTYSGEVLGKL